PAPEQAPLAARVRAALVGRLRARYEASTQRRITTVEADADRVRRELDALRPDYLLGYTATLAVVADELARSGWRPARPLKAVVTIAETLTPERRLAIERCFAAPIANRYGQR